MTANTTAGPPASDLAAARERLTMATQTDPHSLNLRAAYPFALPTHAEPNLCADIRLLLSSLGDGDDSARLLVELERAECAHIADQYDCGRARLIAERIRSRTFMQRTAPGGASNG